MPHRASICAAALFYQLPFQTRDCHDTHATTMQTTEAPKEDVRSTFVHERAIASTHHADREAARTRNPTSRLQQKSDHTRPSAGARFFAEKARAGKCVFLSAGLLIFGQFSGPGKPGGGPFGPPEGPQRDAGGGKQRRPGDKKRAPLNAAGVRADCLAAFLFKNL